MQVYDETLARLEMETDLEKKADMLQDMIDDLNAVNNRLKQKENEDTFRMRYPVSKVPSGRRIR